MIDQEMRDARVRAVRAEVERLRGLDASELPALTYHKEGLWWRDFVLETGTCDVATFEALLVSEALTAARVGLVRSPELLAWIYRWRYGCECLRNFVGEAQGRGEMPDAHTVWLLLHPSAMPGDFPMFREVR